MNELPFYQSIPLPDQKKKEITKCVNELLEKHEQIFLEIKAKIDNSNNVTADAWNVIEEINIQKSIGRLISGITFFKVINMDEKNTLKLYIKN